MMWNQPGQSWLYKTALAAFLLFLIAGCTQGIHRLPQRLILSAPPDGTAVYVGQQVVFSVHAVNPEAPVVTGVLSIQGPDSQTLDLAFQPLAGDSYYVAEAVWTPAREGRYRVQATGRLQNGTEAVSDGVTLVVLAPRPIEQAPMQRLAAAAAHASPTPSPARPSETPPPTTSPSVPCLLAEFVADVTVPDDTPIPPGQSFVKTWRLRNVGSCTWTSGFGVVFSGGDRMDAPDFTPLPHDVAPGQEVDVSVPLRAPAQPGRYRANFLLRSPEGTLFGLTLKLRPFYVEIVVPEFTPTPTQPAPKPDLVVSQVTLRPQDPKPGQSMVVSVIVANVGQGPAGRFTTHWWMEEGGTITCGWTLDSGLAPGQSETFQCAFAAPTTVGPRTGLVGVDLPRNDVPETNEDNNEYRISYTVVPEDSSPPTLGQVSRSSDVITWPAQCPSTNSVTITASVHDPSGVAWVKLSYRVVQGARKGQWVTKDFILVGTDQYQVVLTAHDLPRSLNPPLQGDTPAVVEYLIIPSDTLGNYHKYVQPDLTLEWCIY